MYLIDSEDVILDDGVDHAELLIVEIVFSIFLLIPRQLAGMLRPESGLFGSGKWNWCVLLKNKTIL